MHRRGVRCGQRQGDGGDQYFGTGKDVESVKTYFQTQSSGRYSVDGEVTDWVEVPYSEARYGRDVCGSHVCSNTWALVRDARRARRPGRWTVSRSSGRARPARTPTTTSRATAATPRTTGTSRPVPYNFGWVSAKPYWVEHYNCQTGLLISYWDTSQVDNNTNVHPGAGRNLYIDSHPKPFLNVNGVPWRSRVQVYDAPFGLQPADGMLLHVDGKASPVRPLPPSPIFDDTAKYIYDELPNQGVKLPGAGVKIAVMSQSGTSMTVGVF